MVVVVVMSWFSAEFSCYVMSDCCCRGVSLVTGKTFWFLSDSFVFHLLSPLQVIETLLFCTFVSWKAFFPLVRDDSNCTYTFITGDSFSHLFILVAQSQIYTERCRSTERTRFSASRSQIQRLMQSKNVKTVLFFFSFWPGGVSKNNCHIFSDTLYKVDVVNTLSNFFILTHPADTVSSSELCFWPHESNNCTAMCS